MDEQKRTRLMLGIVLILLLVVVLRFTKSKPGQGSVLDKVTGGNISKLVNNYKNAVSQREITLQERVDFNLLEEELLNRRVEFWSYSKSGSPRGDIQQHLRSLAKNSGMDDMRISIGSERTVSGCEYLKMIDYNVRSSRHFDMKKLTEFLDLVDKETVKYYWNECKIYMSGKNLAFSGSIRVYVLTSKAVSLFGRKS